MHTDSITLWKQRTEARKASGLTVKEWCEQNHISVPTYYYWHRKIGNITPEQDTVPIFAEILIGAKEQNSFSGTSTIQVTWKDISITAADKKSVELALFLLHCLQEQC